MQNELQNDIRYHFMCLECDLEWTVKVQHKEQFENEFKFNTIYSQRLCTCKICGCSNTEIMNDAGEYFNGLNFTNYKGWKMRKKPDNYFGYAWNEPGSMYNKEYLKTEEGKETLKEDKKSKLKMQKMQKEKGFDATECWNLDSTIVQFSLPRLKYFRENLHGYPYNLTLEEWEEILDKIIWAFEEHLKDDMINFNNGNKEYYEKIKEGFELFGKYLINLWD